MNRRVAAWAILGILPAAQPAFAQDAGTVKKEDVKTWITTIDGKEREMRPATPDVLRRHRTLPPALGLHPAQGEGLLQPVP